jgi:regulatory protein
VYLSDGSSFFVLREVQEESALHVGRAIDPVEMERIHEVSQQRAAVQAALSLLSRAPHTREGLRLKLLQRRFDDRVSRAAVARMVELGYVDDRRFATDWLAMRLQRHPEGRAALVANLRKRGIERSTAEEMVDEHFPPEEEERALLRVIEQFSAKRTGAGTGARLASRLAARGFPLDMIRRHLPEEDYR